MKDGAPSEIGLRNTRLRYAMLITSEVLIR